MLFPTYSRGISWLAERTASCQKGLCYMHWVQVARENAIYKPQGQNYVIPT
jgi:hypothetical protein